MKLSSLPGRGRGRAALTIAVCVAACAAVPALAAHPVKSAVYQGTKDPDGVQPHTIKMRLSGSGKRANAYLYCGTPKYVSSIRKLKISRRGTFKGRRKTGSLVIWSMKGKFKDKDTARVTFHLYATCDGHGGRVTLDRKVPDDEDDG